MRKYSPVLKQGRSGFRPRLPATLATVVAVLVFAALGNWQLHRAAEKRALALAFSRGGMALALPTADDGLPRYQRVRARGRYDPDHQFLLDNRSHAGRAGVQVLTPLLLADGSAILVNRGWLPLGGTREATPEISVAADSREVSGRLDPLPRPGIELQSAPPAGWPKLVNYPRVEELSALLRRELRPRTILLDAQAPDGYVRDWHPPGMAPDRHLGYAVQWFALAATAIAIWIALSLQRSKESP